MIGEYHCPTWNMGLSSFSSFSRALPLDDIASPWSTPVCVRIIPSHIIMIGGYHCPTWSSAPFPRSTARYHRSILRRGIHAHGPQQPQERAGARPLIGSFNGRYSTPLTKSKLDFRIFKTP
jgi:hypothetical protein